MGGWGMPWARALRRSARPISGCGCSSPRRCRSSSRSAARFAPAIERLRLAPVMFELGARPHPPRELYRAYLEQSDVFVGIYGERYGWIAPGEEISGLEDEYRLAPARCRSSSTSRQPAQRDERLERAHRRIQCGRHRLVQVVPTPRSWPSSSRPIWPRCWRSGSTRPHASRSRPARGRRPTARIPATYTRLIGRDARGRRGRSRCWATGNAAGDAARAGGIGKSRLAIAVAAAAGGLFPDGTVFVPLENVLEAGLVLPTIAYALGVRDTGELPLEERLAIALEGRRMLLVLDNFEQIVDAAPMLVRAVHHRARRRVPGDEPDRCCASAASRCTRSRRWRPTTRHRPTRSPRARTSPAVELFVDRARAVKPDFAVTDANAAAVVGICRALRACRSRSSWPPPACAC